MAPIALDVLAATHSFDEAGYLVANPDVAAAVRSGRVTSGRAHFDSVGRKEKRRMRLRVPPDVKARKLERLLPLLRTDLPHRREERYFDFLTDELRAQFNIVDTDAVSSNNYDEHVLAMLERHAQGLVLDCGAGYRSIYFDQVVNFEIAPYDTTDVRGVGEILPFKDASFDAVVSIAVLEHVKDPFRCAREIMRVLKPGGELICCVPFLQPLHAFPHHYYNMTHQGLRNLFEEGMTIDRVEVIASVLPIWSLTWIVQSWAQGLSGKARKEFLKMRVSDLLEHPLTFLSRNFVTELPREKNLELASASVLFARKRG